jgi:hypothetical protein
VPNKKNDVKKTKESITYEGGDFFPKKVVKNLADLLDSVF